MRRQNRTFKSTTTKNNRIPLLLPLLEQPRILRQLQYCFLERFDIPRRIALNVYTLVFDPIIEIHTPFGKGGGVGCHIEGEYETI